ncbi:MAG: ATP-NAD kinase family protein [Pseudomonadales bacterium]|nr:ATP-NAD kinase family protein [Pseudomonadales bacterium]
MFRLGLIINPVAGIGGPVGLKGSDGAEIQQQARALGGLYKASQRAAATLELLRPHGADIEWFVCPGSMGQQVTANIGFNVSVIDIAVGDSTTDQDTRNAVLKMNELNLDLLLFVGGDGTARDICSVLRSEQPVLGIPAGVKMQSGVFAVTPEAAGDLICKFIRREQINVSQAEVRDIDEDARRAGIINSRYFGELWVPELDNAIQQVKCCGVENEELDKQEIAAGFIDRMDESVGYLICPGTTTAEIMNQLGLNNTLLGVDLIRDSQLVASDLNEQQLLSFLQQDIDSNEKFNIVISPTGGQGYLFGRGNQQISADVIRQVKMENITVLATTSKLNALEGRGLLTDTGDQSLNHEFSGFIRVVTGFDAAVLYPVGNN